MPDDSPPKTQFERTRPVLVAVIGACGLVGAAFVGHFTFTGSSPPTPSQSGSSTPVTAVNIADSETYLTLKTPHALKCDQTVLVGGQVAYGYQWAVANRQVGSGSSWYLCHRISAWYAE